MLLHQFYDKALSHSSYAIASNGKMVVIDPTRNPKQYYDLAVENNCTIVGVIETHPHADFVSGHLEIHQATGATIYVSKLLGALYPHQSFDDGDEILLGTIKLKAVNTPGHSPDSISIIVVDENGNEHAVFTGDTLFIGDVGRPDLRESVGTITAKREELARDMYHSTRSKLMPLPADLMVYPAHGAGSLCGKALSADLSSTLGKQLQENYALQPMSEADFVKVLLEDQPFVPAYFGYDVELNKRGAANFEESIEAVTRLSELPTLSTTDIIVDTRANDLFLANHLPHSINIQDGGKFETWLGSIIHPDEKFYLVAESAEKLEDMIVRCAKIGYEQLIKAAFVYAGTEKIQNSFDVEAFKQNQHVYTVLDVRNVNEVKQRKIFPNAINIPLPELRQRIAEIPADKPILIHCAAGYRSAAALSILQKEMGTNVEAFDLGERIKEF